MTHLVTEKVLPLNPTLYALLERTFGSVRVYNAGQYAKMVMTRSRENPQNIISVPHSSGEYYAVCCPFCNDEGHKLWINYRFGDGFEPSGRRSGVHLAHCYKDCLRDDPGKRVQLELLVFGSGRYSAPVRSASNSVDDDHVLAEIKPPGDIVPLHELDDAHPAISYLRSRNFDPAQLTADYGVGLCKTASPLFSIMRNRIYIPITANNHLVGWQGRIVGEAAKAPKYYNSPGMKKSRMLYNLDSAKTQPFLVVVEGIPSVWRIGLSAVCLFGKSLSNWQRLTIATEFSSKPVFLVLDNDAQEQTESIYASLSAIGVKVIPVFLPDSRDPADYSREELFDLLQSTADAIGAEVALKI